TVTITINSREYAIACEDGQERRILALSNLLEEKAQLLTDGANQISENMLLVMVALLLADDLNELKKGNPKSEASVNTAALEKLDADIAATVKSLDERIKTLAKAINSL
ncbi:MAG: cell division protein ZapA, partial [Alphaproteobacteria bacterium]|nr:cell division protein ZapA [Alphaproteobacteria bacterium]